MQHDYFSSFNQSCNYFLALLLPQPCLFLKLPGRDPFNQNFQKFRSKTQWIGSVQPEKFRKNGSTFWGGPLFPVGPVGILVEWIAPPISTVVKLIALIYILQGSQPTRLYHKLVLWQLGTFQGICKSTFSSWGEYGVKNDNSVVTFWSNFKWRSKYYCRKFTKLKTTKGPEDSKWLLRNLLTVAIWLLSICLYHVLVLKFPNDTVSLESFIRKPFYTSAHQFITGTYKRKLEWSAARVESVTLTIERSFIYLKYSTWSQNSRKA